MRPDRIKDKDSIPVSLLFPSFVTPYSSPISPANDLLPEEVGETKTANDLLPEEVRKGSNTSKPNKKETSGGGTSVPSSGFDNYILALFLINVNTFPFAIDKNYFLNP